MVATSAFNFYARRSSVPRSDARVRSRSFRVATEETRYNREVKTTKCSSFPTLAIYARNTRVSLDFRGTAYFQRRGWLVTQYVTRCG